MTNAELAMAREWANDNIEGGYFHHGDRALAAAKVVQSLPDQWLDVEELREIIRKRENSPTPAGSAQERELVDSLYGLIHKTPKLPTLADMTPEEREACQWMQCSVVGVPGTHVLTEVRGAELANVLLLVGTSAYFRHNEITPLPDLPKLKWPAQGPIPNKDLLSGVWVDDGSSPLDALKLLVDKHEELDRLSPKEVPSNEPWLIELAGWKAIGTRYEWYTAKPWAVASLNGLFADNYRDSEVTLIRKLVPEPPALPEGMRLADHKEYGRVVVSPETDPIAGYRVFFSISAAIAGATWKYADENELNFLDDERKGE